MKVYAWLIDFAHFRENCPTGVIPEWRQKVTQHNGDNTVSLTLHRFCALPNQLCLLFLSCFVALITPSMNPIGPSRTAVGNPVCECEPSIHTAGKRRTSWVSKKVCDFLQGFFLTRWNDRWMLRVRNVFSVKRDEILNSARLSLCWTCNRTRFSPRSAQIFLTNQSINRLFTAVTCNFQLEFFLWGIFCRRRFRKNWRARRAR